MPTEQDVKGTLLDKQMAYGLLRLTMGVNLGMHGVARLLAGRGVFAEKVVAQFAHTPLPGWSVAVFAQTLPFAEGLIGLLLVLGVGTRYALVLGSLLIVVLTFGSCLIQIGLRLDRSCHIHWCWRCCLHCEGITDSRWIPCWSSKGALLTREIGRWCNLRSQPFDRGRQHRR